MIVKEVRRIAKDKGVKTSYKGKMVPKGVLIRDIQEAEGNNPCFGFGSLSECGNSDCLWFNDCMKSKS